MKYLAILCLVFVLACQPQQSDTLSETEISAVMEATTQYSTAIINGDFEKLRSFMGDDIIMMPPGSEALSGIDAAVGFIQNGPEIEGNISPDQVEGSGNQAYVRGAYNLTFMVNDSTQMQENGKYIEIWKKQEDGSWKVSLDIWNSNQSPEM